MLVGLISGEMVGGDGFILILIPSCLFARSLKVGVDDIDFRLPGFLFLITALTVSNSLRTLRHGWVFSIVTLF